MIYICMIEAFSDCFIVNTYFCDAGKKSTGFRPNLLVKILKSTGQNCQICHMYEILP